MLTLEPPAMPLCGCRPCRRGRCYHGSADERSIGNPKSPSDRLARPWLLNASRAERAAYIGAKPAGWVAVRPLASVGVRGRWQRGRQLL